MAQFAPGDRVTIEAAQSDPLLLAMQRFAVISRVTPEGEYFVQLSAVIPRDQEFGPLPAGRLLPGWRDDTGQWRSP